MDTLLSLRVVSSLNLQILIQVPKFSWDSLFLNFVQINFIRLNVCSTLAVDGGINAARFKILVMSGWQVA